MSDLALGIITGMFIGAPFSMGALLLVQASRLRDEARREPAPKLQPDPLPVAPYKLPGMSSRVRPDGTISYSRTLDDLAPKMARDDEPTGLHVRDTREGSAQTPQSKPPVQRGRYGVAS